MNKRELMELLMEEFKSKLPKINPCEEEMCEKNLSLLIDGLYDENNKFVGSLNEKEVDIFRKINGILSDGKHYSKVEIAGLYHCSGNYIGYIYRQIKFKIKHEILSQNREVIYDNRLLNSSILILKLPQEITNHLFLGDIFKIGDLMKLSISDISKINGIGTKSCKIILETLESFGLYLQQVQSIDVKLNTASSEMDFYQNQQKVKKK